MGCSCSHSFVGLITKNLNNMFDEIITSGSPTHIKLLTLIEVQSAIRSLELVDRRGLATINILKSLEDLRVYERQLIEYLGN